MSSPLQALVEVWVADLDEHAEGERLLSAPERERAARFHFVRDRRRFIAARVLLRRLIANRLGVLAAEVRLEVGPFGKPRLAEEAGSLEFNLSRSGAIAMVAISSSFPVGIDVERVDAAADLSGRFLAPSEHEAIDRLPPADRVAGFFACWTRKEAVLKAVGLGLSYPLGAIEVNVDPDAQPLLLRADPPIDASGWHLRDVLDAHALPGYRACLAASGEIDVRRKVFDWQ